MESSSLNSSAKNFLNQANFMSKTHQVRYSKSDPDSKQVENLKLTKKKISEEKSVNIKGEYLKILEHDQNHASINLVIGEDQSKKSPKKSRLICLFFIFAIFVVLGFFISLALKSEDSSSSKKMSQGELYLLKYFSKSTVVNTTPGNGRADQSVESNSTFTSIIYNMTEEVMSFLLIEGNFYFIYEDENVNIDLNVLDGVNYILVDSDPKAGEIEKINYPTHLISEKVEFFIPFIKVFIVNYQKIEANDTKEDSRKSKMKKSINQDDEFFYMQQNFKSNEIKGKIIFDKQVKKGNFKGVKIENSISQKIDKKQLKLKGSQAFLNVDLKMFEKSVYEQDININNSIEVKIIEAPGKLNHEKLESISAFIGKRNFHLFENEEDQDDENNDNRRERFLNNQSLIINEKVISDVFGNKLIQKITIDQNPKKMTFQTYLALENFFEYEICQGMLPQKAINRIQQIIELKKIFNSKSLTILEKAMEFYNDVKNSNKLLIDHTSLISIQRKNLRFKRINYLNEIFNFLENLSPSSSFEAFSEKMLESFVKGNSNLVAKMLNDSLKISSNLENIEILKYQIEDDSNYLLNVANKYTELEGISSYDDGAEELLNFDTFINNKGKIDIYLQISSYELEFALSDILKESQDYKNQLSLHFISFEERLVEACTLFNSRKAEHSFPYYNCSDISGAIQIKQSNLFSEFEQGLNGLISHNIDEIVEQTRNASVNNMETAFLSLPNLTHYTMFKEYSLQCNYIQVPKIFMNVKVPAGYSLFVPIDIELPASHFHYFIVNESSTSTNISLENTIKIKGSAVLSTPDYEIGAFFDAALILFVIYELGYSFSILKLFSVGKQVTNVNRKTYVFYKEYIRKYVEECWRDECRRLKCRTVDKSYWTNDVHTLNLNEVNEIATWDYFPLNNFSLI